MKNLVLKYSRKIFLTRGFLYARLFQRQDGGRPLRKTFFHSKTALYPHNEPFKVERVLFCVQRIFCQATRAFRPYRVEANMRSQAEEIRFSRVRDRREEFFA